MTLPQDVIGVDIAKGWIDTFTLSTSRHERIPTTKQALARFAKACAGALCGLRGLGRLRAAPDRSLGEGAG